MLALNTPHPPAVSGPVDDARGTAGGSPASPDLATGILVSVVIPAKNEAENIAWVLRRMPDVVDEVVLVDGRSTDGTVDVARSIRPDVVVVNELRRGKGAALRAGVEAASGEFVVMIDADGSMDPQEMHAFLARLLDGNDLVKGSRFLPGAGTADMTPLRAAGNLGLLTLANVLFRSSHTDLCYGFAAFRRDAFLALDLSADGFEIEAQLFLRARRMGLRVAEVASFESPRRVGNSNLNTFRDGWRVLGERARRTDVAPQPRRLLAPQPVWLARIAAASDGRDPWSHAATVTTASVSSATAALFDSALLGTTLDTSDLTDDEVRIAPRAPQGPMPAVLALADAADAEPVRVESTPADGEPGERAGSFRDRLAPVSVVSSGSGMVG